MKARDTAFYLEALALIAAFLTVLLVLTQVFGLARSLSRRAGDLNAAVDLAARAAEAVAAADSLEDLGSLLNEDGGADIRDGHLELTEGGLHARVSWEPEGSLIRSRIDVDRDGALLYSLETASQKEVSP